MAFSAGPPGGRTNDSNLRPDLTGPSSGDWNGPDEEPRDWRKIILVLGLGALSWAATYIGMLELIQANMGTLPITHKILIGFSVAMLMTMIIWLLDQIFSPVHYGTKFFFVIGYIFLSVISVGFGFGFYWKVLESRSESTRSAESAIAGVQTALHAGFTRMQQLNQTLVQLEEVSTAKAVEEREKGTSCPNSRPGDGPRRKLRDADAQSFRFASEFVTRRVGSVKTELAALDADLKKVVSGDSSTFDVKTGTRNEFLRELNRRLDLTVTGFNAFRTDPQLRQIRADLNDRAGKTVFPNGSGGTFACPDVQLQGALRGVVRAIDQLPEMQKPKIAAVEGSEATIEAFRRLTASIMGILTLTPPLTPDELRQLQKKAVQSVSDTGSSAPASPSYVPPTGLGKRDYVPLAIAIFVDLCLLLVSISRPMNRLNGLIPKMREAEKGPVIRILSRFNEIHRDPEIRQNFEVFRHVVFDYLGDYYVAVPLDTPYNRVANPSAPYYGAADAQELQHEAHLLANLFASFEKEKIFRRVYFLPTRTVRARLHRQGSKFAGSSAFRLYRFREGAWSDIILGAVMGAAKRVEAEKEARRAREEQLFRDLGPTLGANTSNHTVGPNGSGEAGPSGRVPPNVLNHTPEKNGAPWAGKKETATQSADLASHANGTAHNGHNGQDESNGKANGASGLFGSTSSAPIIIDEFEDFYDDVDEITAEEEQQIRSRYGKYAEKILAQRTHAAERKAAKRKKTTADRQGAAAHDQSSQSDLSASAANSNTLPAALQRTGKRDLNGDGAASNGASKVIPLPGAQATLHEEPNANPDTDDLPATIKNTNVERELRAVDDAVSATMHDAPATRSETTVTLTRETATYTVPVSEAVLPNALRNATAVAQSQPVVVTQAVLKEEPAESIIDALANAIPAPQDSNATEEPVEELRVLPPPLPDLSAHAPSPDREAHDSDVEVIVDLDASEPDAQS